jgi:branched-chain amino acid transport system permease protein
MQEFATYTVGGLVLGAIFAIAASGLVLTYTTSGIFNFAHGAQAMLAAFLYWQFTVPWGIPVPVAFLLVVGVVGPVLGVLLYQVLMRGLRDVEEVTKIVVTVSVLLGMVALSFWIWEPSEPRAIGLLFGPDAIVEIGGVRIRYHQILCVLSAVALAVLLRLLFTRTRIGVAMRAVVDDPDLLRLNGFNPDRLSMASWAIGAALAAFAGVVITPIRGSSLDATTLTLLVIDVFAAALFGRLRSIPRTFVGAVILGLVTTYVDGYAPTQWDWVANLRSALPAIVLFIVLLVLPQDRLRGSRQMRSRERAVVPSVRQAVIWAGVLVVCAVVLVQVASPALLGSWATAFAFAIIALSLVPLTGYAGQINLVPISLGAVGAIFAYHVGIVGTGLASRMSWVGLVAAVAAAALVGALVALPAVRLRGLYLALATLAFGGIMSNLVLREIFPRNWFGFEFAIFPAGVLVMPRPAFGPLDLDDDGTFVIALAVVFALIGIGLVALRNSGYGRRLAAMRDSPAASAMLGQSLIRLKLGVFALSAGIAGLGGTLLGSARGSLSSDDFLITGSLTLVMLTVVGGVSYVSGALFAGILFGAFLGIMGGTTSSLGSTHPQLEPTFEVLGHLVALLVALTGLGVDKNPSGVVHAICEGFRPLRAAMSVIWGGVAVCVGWVALNLAGVFGDWILLLLLLTTVFALPAVAAKRMPSRILTPAQIQAHADALAAMPERRGLTARLDPDDVLALDARLGVGARRG